MAANRDGSIVVQKARGVGRPRGAARRTAAALIAGVLALQGCDLGEASGSASGATATATNSEPTPSESGPATSDAAGQDPTAPGADAGTPADPAPDGPAPDELVASAAEKLPTLAVKGRAPMTGYDRGLFGAAWTDDVDVEFGHNGCDTRNDVLRRDLVDLELKPGTHECVVLSGTLHDPYSGATISFTRGQATSAAVQIDHVVALADAWQKGAQQMSPQERQNLANDPLNLHAADGPTNQAKGAGDAATWLPPNKAFRCEYVSLQVEVKAKYGLWVTAAERDAIASILTGCGAEPAAGQQTEAPAPQPEAPASNESGEVYYENCAAARAAGAAPLHVGEPGYRPGMDGDGDGVACE